MRLFSYYHYINTEFDHFIMLAARLLFEPVSDLQTEHLHLFSTPKNASDCKGFYNNFHFNLLM